MRLAFLLSHIHLHVAVLNQLNDFRRVCKNAKSVSFVMSVRLYVCMQQLDYHWVDFDEILCLGFFKKSIQKIQVLLKYDKNNWYFT
jgi:hypothetical protein